MTITVRPSLATSASPAVAEPLSPRTEGDREAPSSSASCAGADARASALRLRPLTLDAPDLSRAVVGANGHTYDEVELQSYLQSRATWGAQGRAIGRAALRQLGRGASGSETSDSEAEHPTFALGDWVPDHALRALPRDPALRGVEFRQSHEQSRFSLEPHRDPAVFADGHIEDLPTFQRWVETASDGTAGRVLRSSRMNRLEHLQAFRSHLHRDVLGLPRLPAGTPARVTLVRPVGPGGFQLPSEREHSIIAGGSLAFGGLVIAGLSLIHLLEAEHPNAESVLCGLGLGTLLTFTGASAVASACPDHA